MSHYCVCRGGDLIFDCYSFLYISCKGNLFQYIYYNHFLFLFSGAEAAKVRSSIDDETRANSASRVEEKERSFIGGDHSQVMESRTSQASYNDHSDENRSSITHQGFTDDNVEGKLLLEFSGSFTQMSHIYGHFGL